MKIKEEIKRIKEHPRETIIICIGFIAAIYEGAFGFDPNSLDWLIFGLFGLVAFLLLAVPADKDYSASYLSDEELAECASKIKANNISKRAGRAHREDF